MRRELTQQEHNVLIQTIGMLDTIHNKQLELTTITSTLTALRPALIKMTGLPEEPETTTGQETATVTHIDDWKPGQPEVQQEINLPEPTQPAPTDEDEFGMWSTAAMRANQ